MVPNGRGNQGMLFEMVRTCRGKRSPSYMSCSEKKWWFLGLPLSYVFNFNVDGAAEGKLDPAGVGGFFRINREGSVV